MLALGWFAAQQMQLSWWRVTVRNGFLGLAILGLGAWDHHFLQEISAGKIVLVLGADCVALLGVVRLVGFGIADLRRELTIFRGIFGR
jgi:hypothetical protein